MNITQCPICRSEKLEYEFIVERRPLCRCMDCSLMFLNPVLPEQENAQKKQQTVSSDMIKTYSRSAANYISQVRRYTSLSSGTVLLIGGRDTLIREEFERAGFSVSTGEADDPVRQMAVGSEGGLFDVCILYSVLEKSTDPEKLITEIKKMLKPGGCLMVISISIDSLAARFFRERWWEFRKENIFYFGVNTLQNLMFKAGFRDPIFVPDFRNISLTYAQQRVKELNKPFLKSLLSFAHRLSPLFAKRLPFRFFDSRVIMLSRPALSKASTTLTVIVPAYNEKNTFAMLMETLLAKVLRNIDMEIIIVESNSTDGTREEAQRFQNDSRVQLILEDRPRGKGHAVRTGLAHATGDIILIQDADLEYDIDDYDSLLDPIARHQQCFVIGSRHVQKKQTWKMRVFNDNRFLASVYNIGHVFFLGCMNILYNQTLFDPFSMFKVFRRDCLYGLTFESNRFDFDFEIVIKLLRKGYKPLEIPVNYHARSPKEGKKVNLFRDPFTYVRALLKYRFSKLYGRPY